MKRHGQLMAFSDHKLDGSKNYRNLLQERETESCRQKHGEDEQCCEFSQPVKFRKLRKFRNLGNSMEKFVSPPAL